MFYNTRDLLISWAWFRAWKSISGMPIWTRKVVWDMISYPQNAPKVAEELSCLRRNGTVGAQAVIFVMLNVPYGTRFHPGYIDT